MKIKEILGEEAQAVIKDYKPGQSLSMVDPATDTMTIVDLKKNPTAVATDAEGNLTYDPTPETPTGGPTTGGQANVPKPGDKVNIDIAATEDQEQETEEIFKQWMNSEYAPMDDDSGDEDVVFQKALHFAADHLDNRSDSENLAYRLADMFHGSGMPDDELSTDAPLSEADYITALAKRVAGTDAKAAKPASKDVFDIKKLAGL